MLAESARRGKSSTRDVRSIFSSEIVMTDRALPGLARVYPRRLANTRLPSNRQQSRNFGGGKLWAAVFAACDPVGRVRLRSRSIFAALFSRSADTRATYCARLGNTYGVTEPIAPIPSSTPIADTR